MTWRSSSGVPIGSFDELARCRPTDRRSAAWHRPPTVSEAPKFQCQTLPRADWNALCHGSCSALLGGRALPGPNARLELLRVLGRAELELREVV